MSVQAENTPWTEAAFAELIDGGVVLASSAHKNLRNWKAGGLPDPKKDAHRITNIFREFFGKSRKLLPWKNDLEKALERSREEQAARIARRHIGQPVTVPAQAAHFVGRDRDCDKLVAAILSPENASILVQGGPGMGKTELTKAVAHHNSVTERFGDRRWFVALDAVKDATGLLEAISRALGTDASLGMKGIVAKLRAAPSLIILDNVETPWEPVESRDEVEHRLAELAAMPGLALMASMRGSEIIQRVAWAQIHEVQALSPSVASKLFIDISHHKDATDAYFRKFVKAIDGLPLAIMLVALRAHGHSNLKKLWLEWERIGTQLVKRPGFDPNRHNSLDASITLSLNSPRLTEQSRRLFAILGRVPNGLSDEDRDEVAGVGSLALEESLRWVGLAIERDDRLNLLPPIREFASRLPLDKTTNRRWISCILAPVAMLSDDIQTPFIETSQKFQRIKRSINNIDSAICGTIDETFDDIIQNCLNGLVKISAKFDFPVRTCLRLQDHFAGRGQPIARAQTALLVAHVADRISRLELAEVSYKLAVMLFKVEGDFTALAAAHLQYGQYQNRRHRHRGRTQFSQALKIYAATNDRLGQTNANMGLAQASYMDSSYNTARRVIEESKQFYSDNGRFIEDAECSEMLARIYEIQGMRSAALEHYDFAETVWRDHGFERSLARCLIGRSTLYFRLSDNVSSRKDADEALEIFSAIGDETGVADCLYRRANLYYYESNDPDAGLTDLEAAEETYTRMGDRNGLGACAHFRAHVIAGSENSALFKDYLLSARGHYESAGNACERAQCSYELAALSIEEEDYDNAVSLAIEALAEFNLRGDWIGILNCNILLSEMYITAGEYRDAEDLLSGCLDMSREIKSAFHEARILHLLADIFSQYQRHDQARSAYARAATLYLELGMHDFESRCRACLKGYDYE